MILLGDPHRRFVEYKKLIEIFGWKKTCVLGDMEIGFPDIMSNEPNALTHIDLPKHHKFIRGNHDNPAECRRSVNYLGDYGVLNGSFIDGMFDKLFYISGGYSIDRASRTLGVSWWEDEELCQSALMNMVDLYIEEKPDVVISHIAPSSLVHMLINPNSKPIVSRTDQALETLLYHHRPSYWFFGHYHISWRANIEGTYFVCLKELEYIDISKSIDLNGFGSIRFV